MTCTNPTTQLNDEILSFHCLGSQVSQLLFTCFKGGVHNFYIRIKYTISNCVGEIQLFLKQQMSLQRHQYFFKTAIDKKLFSGIHSICSLLALIQQRKFNKMSTLPFLKNFYNTFRCVFLWLLPEQKNYTLIQIKAYPKFLGSNVCSFMSCSLHPILDIRSYVREVINMCTTKRTDLDGFFLLFSKYLKNRPYHSSWFF